MTDKLLSYHDLWDQFRISRSYVKSLVKTGEFPAPRRVGKKNMWFETEVLEWAKGIAPSAVQPTPASIQPRSFCDTDF